MVEALAIVTSIHDTGTTINDNPRVKLTLNVQPDGAAAFEVTKKVTVSRVNLPRIGDPFRVKYFAGDPEGLKVQRRTPRTWRPPPLPSRPPLTPSTGSRS